MGQVSTGSISHPALATCHSSGGEGALVSLLRCCRWRNVKQRAAARAAGRGELCGTGLSEYVGLSFTHRTAATQQDTSFHQISLQILSLSDYTIVVLIFR